MRAGRAQSRCRCGSARPSPSAMQCSWGWGAPSQSRRRCADQCGGSSLIGIIDCSSASAPAVWKTNRDATPFGGGGGGGGGGKAFRLTMSNIAWRARSARSLRRRSDGSEQAGRRWAEAIASGLGLVRNGAFGHHCCSRAAVATRGAKRGRGRPPPPGVRRWGWRA